MRVPGSSQYLNQATLSNQRGFSGTSPNVLGETAGGISLLDVARSAAPSNGIGLSASARALNNQFLRSNSSTTNQLFSLTGGGSATVDAARTQILALKASTPVSRGVAVDTEA